MDSKHDGILYIINSIIRFTPLFSRVSVVVIKYVGYKEKNIWRYKETLRHFIFLSPLKFCNDKRK